jgi:hypothetical protein
VDAVSTCLWDGHVGLDLVNVVLSGCSGLWVIW